MITSFSRFLRLVPTGRRLLGLAALGLGLGGLACSPAYSQSLPSGWTDQDIGSTGAAGSATYSNGTYTINGAGANIWGTADQFNFAYVAITGDCTIVADMTGMTDTAAYAKAGVMFRESLDPGASFSAIFESPGSVGFQFQERDGTDASASQTTYDSTQTLPRWLKLVRSGNTFTAYASSDGTNWTAEGSQTIAMASSIYVGLDVCSLVSGTLCTATFTHVSISGPLPSGWSDQDIGSTGVAGSATYSNGTYTINGAGANIWGTADQLNFAYEAITGDCTIVADMTGMTDTAAYAKAGVMFRESLDPGASFSAIFESPGSVGLQFQERNGTGASASQTTYDSTQTLPRWLKLVRSGNTFTAYASSDGTNWTAEGSQTIAMASSIYVGLDVCSLVSGTLCTATFSNVSINTGPVVSITAPTDNANVSGTIAVTASASSGNGIASVQFQLDGTNLGSAVTTAPYTINWDTTTATAGSHTLTAIATDTQSNQATSAPVSVTVADQTPPTVSITAPSNNAQVSGTVTVSATASDNVAVASVQFQLDGANLGSPVTTAPYSVSWDTTTASNGSHTLTAVATDTSNNQATSTAVTVTVANSGGLPAGWSNEDIGSPGAPGSTSYANGTYTISGAGAGAYVGTSDQFQYAYEQVTGDCTVIAQVESVEETSVGTSPYPGRERGGIMIRETLDPGSSYAAVYETSANGLLYQSRDSTGADPVEGGADSTHLCPYWVKLTRSGTTFTAYSSPDGSTWTQLGTAETISMASTMYVGLAVTSTIEDTPTTAVIDNFSVETGPTVSITAPANDANVSGTVAVTASASSGLGIAGVQFQLDGTNLGSAVTAAPYTINWDTTTATAGSHTLTAIATDTQSNQTTSAPVSVTVADQTPPTVSITAPSNNAQVSGTVTVSANASDNVAVASVQFQLDGANLGSPMTTAPYSVSWDTTTASNGSHTLTAVATDTSNNQATSTAVTVTVANSGALPADWSNEDIGSPGAPGSTSYSDGTYTISGAGAGVFGTSDQFQYAYEPITGNCTVVAEVQSVQETTVGTSPYPGRERGGVMIRETLDPDSTYAAAYETSANGLIFQSRDTTGGSEVSDDSNSSDLCPYWVMLTRNGTTFTAYSSPDGSTWTQMGSPVTISMASTVYVGLAVTSTIEDTPTTAVIDNVSIIAQPGPTVAITAPADNAEVSGTASVTASASSDNGIASVQFQLDGANLGSAVTSSPYTYSWDTTTASNGDHVLTAIATDTLGYQTGSDGVTVSVSNSGGGSGSYNPNFPRLGIYAISGDQSYPSTAWATLAKFHVVILSGDWESWPDGGARNRETVVSGIKSASAIGTKVFQYVDFNEALPPGSTDPDPWFPTFSAQCAADNWWLYESGTSGTEAPSTYEGYLVNMTHYAPVDPGTGLRPYQWAAQFAYNEFYAGTLTAGNGASSLDGFYLDNVFSEPRTESDADWNRDGTPDDSSDPTVQSWLRTGELDFFTEMNTLMPGAPMLGNNASWPNLSTTDPTAVAPLNGALNGGVAEGMLGASYSPEVWGTPPFTTAMDYYEYYMNTLAAPQLEIFQHQNLGYNNVPGADPYDPTATPYQSMRYGLCFCLMNNGYYYGAEWNNVDSATPADILWFDEYDNAGQGEGYLGQPVAGPTGAVQTAPRWNYGTYGVWAREFAGGLVILNPIGNGAQTLTITDLGGAGLWTRINGTQCPSVNTGQPVTGSITLQDRDGIILLRQ